MLELSTDFQIHLLAESTGGSLINMTFEALAQHLQSFERMHFEMDGSFVWTGITLRPWQLDGMVYDLGQQIQRIELKGQCPRVQWKMVLVALNHPQQSLVVYNLKTSQFETIPHLESTLWST
jgi:hypothetical protein